MLRHAPRPLQIETYDGSGQCVHPDVQMLPQSIFGDSLVMVMEPYPFSDERLEKPSLLVSSDGLDWRIPPGVRNPVVGATPPGAQHADGGVRGWYSDAALILLRADLLGLYYRFNSGQGETVLLCSRSVDGRSWSKAETLLRLPVSGRFASPSLAWHGDRLFMTSVDTVSESIQIRWAERSDDTGSTWSAPRQLLDFKSAWHASARCYQGRLYLLINDRHSLWLMRCDLGARVPRHQFWSKDGWTGYSTPGTATPILGPSPEGWDAGKIYHGSFLLSNSTIRIWYSAQSTDGRWHIGATHGPFDW